MFILNAGHLCDLCRTYDFDELFNAPVRDCHEEHMAEDLPRCSLPFGSLNELQGRSKQCEICAFLTEAWFQARLPSREIRPDDQLVLRRLRARKGVLGWNDIIGVSIRGMDAGCAQLEIVNAGHNGVTVAFDPCSASKFNSMVRFRTFTPDELHDSGANLSLVESWMKMCQDNHPRCRVCDPYRLLGAEHSGSFLFGNVSERSKEVQCRAHAVDVARPIRKTQQPSCCQRKYRLHG